LKHLSAIDIIDDAYCDRCTLRLTLSFYLSEADRLGKPKDENGKSSTARKKRAANARKIANKLSKLLETGSIADMEKAEGLQDCKWLKATSRSARQSMIARVSGLDGRSLSGMKADHAFLLATSNPCVASVKVGIYTIWRALQKDS
jgi:hypothetical protein